MKKIFFLLLAGVAFMFACTKSDNNTNSSNNNNTNTVPKVKACFTVGTTSPVTGTAVTFDASCSQNASTYLWRVDGIPIGVVTVTASETFTSAGSHTISLTAFGVNGAGLDSTSQTINVAQLKPTSCFNITSPSSSDSSYPVNTQITFDASCSADAGVYRWVFGDRDQYGDPNPPTVAYSPVTLFTYTVKGTYKVELLVQDPTNTYSATRTKQITIY